MACDIASEWFHIVPESCTIVAGSLRSGPSCTPIFPVSFLTEWQATQDFSRNSLQPRSGSAIRSRRSGPGAGVPSSERQEVVHLPALEAGRFAAFSVTGGWFHIALAHSTGEAAFRSV